MDLQLYWGDIHCHCGISYGQGSLDRALAIAQAHLDFCAVTGHAVWPDMPTNRDQYGHIIDFHNEGFARFAGMLDDVKAKVEAAHRPHEFVTFHSYEWHNCEFGDHNIYHTHPNWQIEQRPTLEDMRAALRATGGLIIPHHIGYVRGSRGINWDAYTEELSPFAEIYSMHGCSESDTAAYPMLHSMGPRDYGSTAEYGYRQGHHFGIVAGTDHHAGFPGSHGDGVMAVWAESLTRDALWDAFKARRVYGVTGDRIAVDLRVNDAPMGAVVEAGPKPTLSFRVAGADRIDYVELLQNGERFAMLGPEPADAEPESLRAKIRVEWGWGSKARTIHWDGKLRLGDGCIVEVQPCFQGDPVLSPDDFQDDPEDVPHKLAEVTDTECAWTSLTRGNPTVRHRATNGLVVAVDMPRSGEIDLEINGQRFRHTLAELIEGARVHMMRGVITEAARVYAVPEEGYTVEAELELDEDSGRPVDYYQLRVRQHNDHWAWVTPVWVTR